MTRPLTPLGSDERATSPTVGAVLLVGITVLLATAAGSQLFGLVGSEGGTFATATVEYSSTEDRVTVTWLANAGAEKLHVRIQVGDDHRTVALEAVGDRVVVDEDGIAVSSGTVRRWPGPAVQHGDRVTVTVIAVKGGEQVVIADKSNVV